GGAALEAGGAPLRGRRRGPPPRRPGWRARPHSTGRKPMIQAPPTPNAQRLTPNCLEVTRRPTPAERFFFDNNGYLALEGFLDADHLAALRAALARAVARRRSPEYHREHPPAFPERLEGPNVRIFHLLDEDPLFLDLMDYPPLMEYVRALFNPAPH